MVPHRNGGSLPGEQMKQGRQRESEEETLDLGNYFAAVRRQWWKIAGLSLAVGAAMLAYMSAKPNLYRAWATITPAVDESKQSPAFGAIASLGIPVGGPTKIEDLESLFKSNDLTVRVFRKHGLWPVVYGDAYDPKTGTTRPGWTERLLGNAEGKAPGDWDAIRWAKEWMAVIANRRMGTLSVSFQSRSPEGSAEIVRFYLDEARTRLQEEAFDRANRNKKFIEEQIGKTVDALTRDRLYSLYGQEVEREMMARNREQFGFRIVETPRAPDRKSGPGRLRAALLGTVAGFLVFSVIAVSLGRKSRPTE